MAGKTRTLFSIAGVAVATLLLAFVVALYRGWNEETVAYIEQTKADFWVVGTGADSFFTPSLMFTTTLANVQGVPGVARADGIMGKPVKLSQGDKYWDSYVIGFNTRAEGEVSGGPVRMLRGNGKPGDGEIVIDDVLARTAGLDIGDEIKAGVWRLKVVGISSGGNLVLAQLSFVNRDMGQLLVGQNAIVNFILVQAKPGQSEGLADRIESSVKGVDVYPAATFADNSRKVLQRSVLPILLVIVIMAVLVGTLVVGLTVYTAVVEKEREYGVLKALGVPGRGLARVVLEQSAICGLLGFVAGIVLAFAVAGVAGMILPQITTLFLWQDIGLVFLATAVMSIVASIIPTQRVARVDALAVFKA